MNKRLAIDFDGTIKDWGSSEPEPNVKETLEKLKSHGYYISIHSCRTSDEFCDSEKEKKKQLLFIKKFLRKHDIPYDEIIDYFSKPVATYYIDDSAIGYRGDWNLILKEILENEKEKD